MVGVGIAFVVAAVSSWLLLPLGARLGFIDRPDGGLKPHQGSPVPLGGVALILGLLAGLAILGELDGGLMAGATLVLAMGLVDDRIGLSPTIRLAGTSLAALLMIVISNTVDGPVPIVAAALLVVVSVNAVNLIDGLDGLASTTSALAAVGIAVFSVALDAPGALAPVALSGALAGVLLFNLPPARLYLGDNGSYVVGLALAWSALRVSVDWPTGLVAAGLLGVPLLELGVTIIRRLRSGAGLLAGDRDHTYDRLYYRTGSVVTVVVAFAIVQIAWSGLIVGAYLLGGASAGITAGLVAGVGCLAWGWLSAPGPRSDADRARAPDPDPSSRDR